MKQLESTGLCPGCRSGGAPSGGTEHRRYTISLDLRPAGVVGGRAAPPDPRRPQKNEHTWRSGEDLHDPDVTARGSDRWTGGQVDRGDAGETNPNSSLTGKGRSNKRRQKNQVEIWMENAFISPPSPPKKKKKKKKKSKNRSLK